MKDVIAKWFAWLKQATSVDDGHLSHECSDGRQLWATNGYVMHALDVASEQSGRVTLNEEGLFQVEGVDGIPPFAGALPQGEPAASIVISAEALRHVAARDHYPKDKPIILVLTGSHIDLMVDMLDYHASLYGRFTGQLPLGPLPFAALQEFSPPIRPRNGWQPVRCWVQWPDIGSSLIQSKAWWTMLSSTCSAVWECFAVNP